MLTLKQMAQLTGVVVLDTETNGLHYWENKIIGLGFFHPDSGEVGYFPTCDYVSLPYGKVKTKRERTWTGEYAINPATGRRVKVYEERMHVSQAERVEAVPNDAMIAEAKAAVALLAANPKVTIVGHNLKFDAHFLDLDLWGCAASIGDTSIAVHLWDSRLPKALAKAEEIFLGASSKRSLVQSAVEESSYKLPMYWTLEQTSEYCKGDCSVTAQLYAHLLPKLEEMELTGLYTLQMRFLRLCWHMERVGMLLDIPQCEASLALFQASLEQMEAHLKRETGNENLNWKSNPQLSAALYEGMGVERPVNPFADDDGVDRTKFAHRGRYNQHATSSFLLMEKANHPLGWLIQDLREASKLAKTIASYIELADKDSVIHPNFRITGTRTGRLSCGDPNVQNIASDHRVRETQSVYSGGGIRSDQYNLRRNFVARPGRTFASFDHKQQEMRMFGILAEDEKMMEILASGMDVHLGVAKMVWGDCGEERNMLHREWSKTIGFGLIYGMTTGSLQFRLNKTAEEAQALAEQYWNTFPRIQPFLKETIAGMHQDGFVRYWSGRIWREEEPDDFYKAANAQVQGGSADLMSLAAYRMQKVLDKQGWGNVVSIIHDELLAELYNETMQEAIPVLARVMWAEDIFNLPFYCDLKTGRSYGEMEKGTLNREQIAQINWKDYQ